MIGCATARAFSAPSFKIASSAAVSAVSRRISAAIGESFAASTSANAFTIHVVAQAVQDVGKKRKLPDGSIDPNSGVGHIDADDKVTAEHWARMVLARVPDIDGGGTIATDPNTGGPRNKYKVLYYRVLENSK